MALKMGRLRLLNNLKARSFHAAAAGVQSANIRKA
jgi:hypothetical protein